MGMLTHPHIPNQFYASNAEFNLQMQQNSD